MKTLTSLFSFIFITFFSFSQVQEYSSPDGPWDMKLEFRSSGRVMYKAKGKLNLSEIKKNSFETENKNINEKVLVLIDNIGHQDFMIIDENDVFASQRQVNNLKISKNSVEFIYTGYQWKDGIIIQEYDMNFTYSSDPLQKPFRYFYDKIENITVLVEYNIIN